MVTRNVNQSANEVQDVLDERDIQGLGAVSLGAAGGVVLAQEVADRVLPLVGFPREPTSATGFGVSAGVKGVTALGLGVLARQMSGIGLVITAFGGVGALAGAGADLLNAVQRTSVFAEMPQHSQQATGGSGNPSGPSPSRSRATATGDDGGLLSRHRRR